MIRRGFFLLMLLFSSYVWSQNFRLNGLSSNLGGGCYEVTDSIRLVPGAVWDMTALDLNQPFDINVDFMLGCTDIGADGMTFSLVNRVTAIGRQGGFLGINGVNPAFSVEFDTYRNPQFLDPVFDHMAIMGNGNNDHSTAQNLLGPVSIRPDSGNVEDCAYHDVRVTWDPVLDSFKVYYDCELRLAYQGDIITDYFSGNSSVFWGITAGTGSVINRHRFCLNYLGTVNELRDTTVCIGDTVDLNTGTGFSYAWSPAVAITDLNIPNPRVFPTTTTTYTVIVTDECGGQRFDTVVIRVDDPADLAVDLGRDTILCPGQSLVPRLQPTAPITWQDMSNADTFLIQAAGIYWAEKTNVCGTQRDSILVGTELAPSVNLGLDQNLCDQASTMFDATFASITFPTTYRWQDGSVLPTFTASTSGSYSVAVTNFCGTARDTVEVSLRFTPPAINFGPDQVRCEGDPLTLDITANDAEYRWSDGVTTDSVFTISQDGLYWGERYNVCGAVRDSIEVLFDKPIQFNLGADTALCVGEQLRLDMGTFPRTRYRWNNGAATQDIIITDEAVYTANATNECGTARDTILVLFDSPPPPVDLGVDFEMCMGDTFMLNAFSQDRPSAPNSYLWEPEGETGYLYTVQEAGIYTVTVSNRCGAEMDDITVTTVAPPQVPDFPDTTLCDDEFVRRDVSWPEANYLWEDGSVFPVRDITQGGLYTIEVSNICGAATDSFRVESIDCECTVFMPSAFSPNGDGNNERFFIIQNCLISDVRLEIYNRWGKQVFSANGPDASWDGTFKGQSAPEGVYVWVLSYQGRFRRNTLSKRMNGTVTLIR
ncbi:MAG: gliding motility-associated C-terminal domain-containing protein [Bacteroidia bacterium]